MGRELVAQMTCDCCGYKWNEADLAEGYSMIVLPDGNPAKYYCHTKGCAGEFVKHLVSQIDAEKNTHTALITDAANIPAHPV